MTLGPDSLCEPRLPNSSFRFLNNQETGDFKKFKTDFSGYFENRIGEANNWKPDWNMKRCKTRSHVCPNDFSNLNEKLVDLVAQTRRSGGSMKNSPFHRNCMRIWTNCGKLYRCVEQVPAVSKNWSALSIRYATDGANSQSPPKWHVMKISERQAEAGIPHDQAAQLGAG